MVDDQKEPRPLRTYSFEHYCGNCHHSATRTMPFGTLVDDDDRPCTNCGCTIQQTLISKRREFETNRAPVEVVLLRRGKQ